MFWGSADLTTGLGGRGKRRVLMHRRRWLGVYMRFRFSDRRECTEGRQWYGRGRLWINLRIHDFELCFEQIYAFLRLIKPRLVFRFVFLKIIFPRFDVLKYTKFCDYDVSTYVSILFAGDAAC